MIQQAPSVSTAHYWTLPSPRSFVTDLREATKDCAAVAILVTGQRIPGLRDRIEEALDGAHVEARTLDVAEGASLPASIGSVLSRSFVTAAQLATFGSGQQQAIVLRPQSAKAEEQCRRYFTDFVRALDGGGCVIHLVVLLRDGDLHNVNGSNVVRTIRYDGALEHDEMRAYVAQRMIGRDGPGSTRLLAALVTEYAGFDAHLAEQLMRMSDMDILALPNSLSTLVSAEEARWAAPQGKETSRTGGQLVHPLREWYLALHDGPQQTVMQVAASKRYWRACVHALMPWMEERRLQVLQVIRKPLESLAAASGGKLQRPLYNGTSVPMDFHEVEYNSVVGMERSATNRLHIPRDGRSLLALDVCKAAKEVRNMIAHLKRPEVTDILTLVEKMDALLETS